MSEDLSVRMCRELWQKIGLCIPCLIENGRFSAEKVFRLNTPHGERSGFCDTCHVLNAQAQSIADDWLPDGVCALGFVMCRVVNRNGRLALIEAPPGESEWFTVPLDYLVEFGPGVERDWVSFGAASLREWKFESAKGTT